MIISHPSFKKYQRKPLSLHLSNVAAGSKARIQRLSLYTQLISKDALADLAFRIGLLHDLGKASSFFQDYIHGGRKSPYTRHSLISAIILYYNLLEDERWKDFALIGFKAVQRHHGNLSAFGTERLDDGVLIANTLKIYEDIRTQIAHDEDLDSFVVCHKITLPNLDKNKLRTLRFDLEDFTAYENLDDAIERFFLQNLLFSALIDADKYDAARIDFNSDQSLKQKISYSPEAYLQSFNKEDNDLNRIRGELLHAAENVDFLPSGSRCFAMSAPTGSGKTLACMGFAEALQAAISHPRRVIYCLPYTSIIDQNHEVIDKIFKNNGLDSKNDDLLLKHHHLMDYSRPNQGDDYDYHDYLNDHLLADSWNAACVVSTFVQLFHSLIGSRNSMVRKLHNIINSILLLDEVQCLPPKYYLLLRRIFAVLAQRFDTYILTCTATQPFIYEPGSYLEISPPQLFDHPVFNRVKLHIHKDICTLEDFVQDLNLTGADNALFVMNTKRSALNLFELLKKQYHDDYTVFCLTTYHAPVCRLQRIKAINDALHDKRRILLVSTQLIEAGVDLSFCRVYRDMGPLDSIIQVAGRCNRHGELGVLGGEMHLLRLGENGKEYSTRIYDKYLIEKTRETLLPYDELESLNFADLIREYYLKLEFGAEAKALLNAISELNYDQDIVGQLPIDAFRLIEDQYATSSVYILLDPDAQIAMDDLILAREELKNNDELSPNLESQARLSLKKAYNFLAKYQLNLSDSERKNYSMAMSYFNKLDDYVYYVTLEGCRKAYSCETGFILNPSDTGSALSL